MNNTVSNLQVIENNTQMPNIETNKITQMLVAYKLAKAQFANGAATTLLGVLATLTILAIIICIAFLTFFVDGLNHNEAEMCKKFFYISLVAGFALTVFYFICSDIDFTSSVKAYVDKTLTGETNLVRQQIANLLIESSHNSAIGFVLGLNVAQNTSK